MPAASAPAHCLGPCSSGTGEKPAADCTCRNGVQHGLRRISFFGPSGLVLYFISFAPRLRVRYRYADRTGIFSIGRQERPDVGEAFISLSALPVSPQQAVSGYFIPNDGGTASGPHAQSRFARGPIVSSSRPPPESSLWLNQLRSISRPLSRADWMYLLPGA